MQHKIKDQGTVIKIINEYFIMYFRMGVLMEQSPRSKRKISKKRKNIRDIVAEDNTMEVSLIYLE